MPKVLIDLRSDTVTRPTPEMRRLMADAEVGDDVFGEDPTVRGLEAFIADFLGKEDAVFVPSGTMGNQLALKIHTRPGDEVILDASAHIFNYESGGSGLLSGVQLRTLQSETGIVTAAQVEAAIRPGFYWEPRSRLLCLENTVNKTGGVIFPVGTLTEVARSAKNRGLRTHLDGARLWNASVATGVPEREYAAPFDTVNVCFSKGLGAPVGSMLAGSSEMISEARRYRKMFGGGMRQVGILAAAARYAVERHRDGLARDHDRARRLAEAIAGIDAFRIDLDLVQTNIIIFDVRSGDAGPALAALEENGVRMVPFGPATIRATLHRDISDGDVNEAISILRRIFYKSPTGHVPER